MLHNPKTNNPGLRKGCGCANRLLRRAASAACISKSGLPVDDSGPVPETDQHP